eukprot:2393775-Pyramimonas_sp.AAC.1
MDSRSLPEGLEVFDAVGLQSSIIQADWPAPCAMAAKTCDGRACTSPPRSPLPPACPEGPQIWRSRSSPRA